MKKKKRTAFSVPSYQGHRNFPRYLPSLAPPQSLPPGGLLLLQSYWSELGYSAISRCKEDWLRPVSIHCPNFEMLLPIYEQNQDSGSKEESSNGELLEASLVQLKSIFLMPIHTRKCKDYLKWRRTKIGICLPECKMKIQEDSGKYLSDLRQRLLGCKQK